jgi:hypothetical protein
LALIGHIEESTSHTDQEENANTVETAGEVVSEIPDEQLCDFAQNRSEQVNLAKELHVEQILRGDHIQEIEIQTPKHGHQKEQEVEKTNNLLAQVVQLKKKGKEEEEEEEEDEKEEEEEEEEEEKKTNTRREFKRVQEREFKRERLR